MSRIGPMPHHPPGLTASPLLATVLFSTLLLVTAMSVLPGPACARGWLGVSVQDVSEELQEAMGLAARSGALVSDVVEDGPADKAGILARDIILGVDDRPVENSEDLIGYLRTKEEGDRIAVRAMRGSREVELEVILGDQAPREDRTLRIPHAAIPPALPGIDDTAEFPARALHLRPGPALGVSVHWLDKNLAPYFRTEEGRGLLVLDVVEESPAAKAGVRTGDVILSFNGRRVGSASELRDEVRPLGAGDDWKAVVLREGREKEVRGRMERGWRSPSDVGDLQGLERFPDRLEDPGLRPGATSEQGRALKRVERRLEELQDKLERLEERLARRLRD